MAGIMVKCRCAASRGRPVSVRFMVSYDSISTQLTINLHRIAQCRCEYSIHALLWGIVRVVLRPRTPEYGPWNGNSNSRISNRPKAAKYRLRHNWDHFQQILRQMVIWYWPYYRAARPWSIKPWIWSMIWSLILHPRLPAKRPLE